MKRLACWFVTCAILVSVAILGGCGGAATITLTFPGGTALAIDQGQSITINVTATNDGGDGVNWACTGAACTTLASMTTTSVQFNATGATGTATITATSIKNTTITKSVTITVNALPSVTTTQGQLTVATAGVAYSFAFTATGGSGNLTWSATGLSDGLSMSASGTISGTPTTQGTVTFTVTVKDSSAAGQESQTSGTLTITVNPAPVLSISKSHVGSFTQGQQNATYTVTVSNAIGAGPTVGTVTVTESVPSGETLVSMAGTGWTCPANGTTCTRGDALAAGSSYPPITVTVNVTANATTPQVNHVGVSGGGSASANGTDSTVIISPVLSITKTHVGSFTQGEQNATYTVTVSNIGTASTSGTVTVTETVPSGETLVSMAGTGWTCPENGTTCTRSDALPIASSYPTITVTVNVSATAPTPQNNQVSVSGGGSASANTSDSTVIVEPVLGITKTHTGNFTQGQQNATYTVTVSNSGTAPTSGTVTVTETVPSGETLVSMAGTGWSCSSNTCNRSDALAIASSYPAITVTVNVAASATSPQNNQVSVSGGGSATANGSDSTTIVEPVLSITKTHTGNFAVSQQNATYTVTVTNNGTAATNGTTVEVTDTIPSGETLVSMAGTGWTCPGGGGANTCDRSDSLAGSGASYPTITVTVNVAANATSPQNNQVSVSGGGSVTANASDSTTITGGSSAENCTGAPTGHESTLNGHYVFLFQGWSGSGTGTPQAYVASFAADGSGHITNLGSGVGGEVDTNGLGSNGLQHFTLNSTSADATALYTVGEDPTGAGDLGCVVLTQSGSPGPSNAATFRFSLGKKNGSSIYTKGRIIEFDDTTGTGSRGSGVMLLQTTPFATQAQSYAFGASGWDSTGRSIASGGFVTVSSNGTITNLTSDFDDAGTVDDGLAGPILGVAGSNGSVGTPDATAGRSIVTTNFQIGSNTATSNFAAYQVDSNEYFYISTDAVSSNIPLLSGRIIATHAAGGFSNSSLSGNYVIHGTGNDGGIATASLGPFTLSSGTISGTIYNYESGSAESTSTPSGTYAVASQSGRTPLSGSNIGNHPPILYVTTPSSSTEPISAFLVGTDSSGLFGFVEASSGTFTTAGLAGNYFLATENPGDNTVSDSVGVLTITSLGAITGTQDKSGSAGLSTGSLSGNTVTITDSNGTGNLGTNTFAITNGESIFFFDAGTPQGSSSAKINVIEKQ